MIAFTICAGIVFSFISNYFERKTFTGPWNYMSKLNEFYASEEDTLDYIGVGSSHLYCTINPLEVWNESGTAGFVLATQQQPLVASYHYIKEAFKTQSPNYVILEGFMITGDSNYDSAVLYDAIDPLKPSLNKLQMINSLVEYEKRPEYYFNVLKYHTRWDTVQAKEINTLFNEPVDTYKGFVPLKGDYLGKNRIPDEENTKDVALSDFHRDTLNDIYDLVTKNGAELILLFGPYDAEDVRLCEMVKAEKAWAREKSIDILDYSELLESIEINPECDYYDSGHLDASGAAKVSRHFAAYLKEKGAEENTLVDRNKWQTDYDAYRKSFAEELEDKK
ncbi:MAG: hypothetical protein IKD18_07005 [Clostridia bacterium]|nr:hypothetical protein [Clostridia bacterium]